MVGSVSDDIIPSSQQSERRSIRVGVSGHQRIPRQLLEQIILHFNCEVVHGGKDVDTQILPIADGREGHFNINKPFTTLKELLVQRGVSDTLCIVPDKEFVYTTRGGFKVLAKESTYYLGDSSEWVANGSALKPPSRIDDSPALCMLEVDDNWLSHISVHNDKVHFKELVRMCSFLNEKGSLYFQPLDDNSDYVARMRGSDVTIGRRFLYFGNKKPFAYSLNGIARTPV